MSTFLTLALIIGLPIAASNGALYRGAWAGIAVISFVLGLGMGMTPAPPDTPGSTITSAEVKQWLFNGLMFISFASFLAVCFYRKAKTENTQE
jgi:hypothetical protein